MVSTTKTNYSKRYPNVRVGFGAYFEVKLTLRSFFSKEFWHNLWWELRYAWKRATCGYDDHAVFDMDNHVTKYLIRLLLELAETTSGTPLLEEFEEKTDEERFMIWRQKLSDVAAHLYESLTWEESDFEKNQFREEYFHSHDFGTKETEEGHCQMVDVPKNGYTQEQVDELRDKYLSRDEEIRSYKSEQLELAMKKLTAVFPYLWD